jgi:iron complex transport system substrate-binding protein
MSGIEKLRTTFRRSRAVALVLAGAVLVSACGQTAAPAPTGKGNVASQVSVTDVVGRTVQLKLPVERMIFGEGRLIYLSGLLQKDDPFRNLVGWQEDLRTADLDSWTKYREAFPQQMEKVTEFGTISSGAFSAEKAIELKPDVMVLSVDTYGPAQRSGLMDRLEQAGIPSVVLDFRQQPLENTVPSTILLGRLLGREEQAQAFVDFYLRETNKVFSKIDSVKAPIPSVFLHRAPGLIECCATFGRANLGMLIERAGGNNLGSGKILGWSGTFNPEQVLTSDPELIIATGSNWDQSATKRSDVQFVRLGYGARADEARAQLQKLADQPGWGNLQAVKNRKLYAVWHQFYNSPYHFAILQQFAKWLHPQEFADLDPQKSFQEVHDKFLPIKNSGTFWVGVGDS